jgi:DNA-binding transcriptional LysR family regulator
MVDLPVRRLPSLNGIKAFEAAARTGSFAAAAAELHVSAAAISRLVHLLEARLGIALFDRRANRLVATAAGRAHQAGLTPLLDALAALTEQVAAPAGPRALTIGVGPTFAIRWLIPRLAGFRRLEPEIEVRFATGGRAVPFADGWTCGIALGDGTWPGLACEPLFAADLLPVCAPALAAAPARFRATSSVPASCGSATRPRTLAAVAGGRARRPRRVGRSSRTTATLSAWPTARKRRVATGIRPISTTTWRRAVWSPLRAQRAEGAPLVPAVSPGRAGRPHLRRLPVVADGRSPRAGPGDPVILAVPSRRFYNRPVLRRTKTAALRPGTLERRSMEQVSPRLDNLGFLPETHVGMSARIARR